MEVLNNNGTFFNDLKRIAKKEMVSENIRTPSIANTYMNEPQFQNAENKSRNYARTGQAKYADPFPIKSRPYDNSYDGRNLRILNTLAFNKNVDKPDVISINHLKVVGYY